MKLQVPYYSGSYVPLWSQRQNRCRVTFNFAQFPRVATLGGAIAFCNLFVSECPERFGSATESCSILPSSVGEPAQQFGWRFQAAHICDYDRGRIGPGTLTHRRMA